MKRTCWLPYLAMAYLLSATVALGQSATLTTAREVGKEGLVAYRAGKYEVAATKFLQAYGAVRAPSLAVFAARALAKSGKLVRASELYLQAERLEPKSDWLPLQREMQQVAASERQELLPRIPRLTIQLEGAKPEEIEVNIDGVAIPTALIKAKQVVDPGTRTVTARRGSEVVTQVATLAEGERKSVTLQFAASAASAAASPAQPGLSSVAARPSPTRDTSSSEIRTERVLGWAGLGVAGVGLAFGTVTAVLAKSKRSDLQGSGSCDGNSCYPESSGDVDSYNRLRTLSTVGFVAAAAGAAAGVTLLWLLPDKAQPEAALVVGLGQARLQGRF